MSGPSKTTGVPQTGRAAPIARQSRVAWTGAASFFFATTFLMSLAEGFGMADESWRLLVATRLASGDVPYRDFFFGATPLSLYADAALVSALGSEMWVMKAATALTVTTLALLAGFVAGQLGVGRRGAFLLATVVAFGGGIGGYSGVAAALQLASLGASIRFWMGRRGPGSLAMAGLFAGLAFSAKQNVGLLTIAAVIALASCAYFGSRDWRRRTMAALASTATAFVVGAGLVLLPVLWSGAWRPFLDQAFLAKGRYLEEARIPYLAGLRLVFQTSGFNALTVFWQAQKFLLPPVAIGAAMVAWRTTLRPDRPSPFAPALLFALAALAGAYPRLDAPHVTVAVPALLVLLALSATRLAQGLTARRARVLFASALLWVGAGTILLVCTMAARAARPSVVVATLPHVHGVLLDRQRQATLASEAAALRAASGGSAFLLTPEAAGYYLISGVRNPTRYDYPLSTAFGRDGEADVAGAIVRGELPYVCLGIDPTLVLSPARLVQAVQQHMIASDPLGPCVLYRARGRADLPTYRTTIDAKPGGAGVMQVFWDDGAGFREERSVRFLTTPTRTHYTVRFETPALAALRWDPCERADCMVRVQRIRIVREGAAPAEADVSDLGRWTGRQMVRVSVGDHESIVHADGPDPWFVIETPFGLEEAEADSRPKPAGALTEPRSAAR